ncbi:hypothetical protein MKX01_024396 [Papaver californicum]|nr:hypothetical protein MKX01_024396 [Papaver californicum]
MRRGKNLEIKRIEDKTHRQVAFARRKKTLFKKARELSDLCDEVALIIFSSQGKLYEFSSSSSMFEKLEKFEMSNSSLYLPSDPVVNDIENEAYQEYLQLKARAEVLQQNHRNLQGEGLETLAIEELDQLDNQLEVSLRQVRSEMTQSMFGHLAELQQKEQMLHEANKTLNKKKMEENSAETALRLSWQEAEQQRQQLDEDKAEVALQLSWQAGEQQRQQQMHEDKAENALQFGHGKRVNNKGRFHTIIVQNAVASECFFQALECSPSLQIRNNQLRNTGNMMNVAAPAQDLISFFPGWML